MRLVPCEACARHVRVDAERCFFCDAPRTTRDATRPPCAGLSRAALYAAIVTSAACRKEAARADVATDAGATDAATPLVVDAAPAPAVDMTRFDAAPVEDAAADASTRPPPKPGKRAGASCSSNGECAAGLACCVTGFCPRIRPGMGIDPDDPRTVRTLPPCTPPRTCVVAPCRPLPNPPYGCVFPDACGRSIA